MQAYLLSDTADLLNGMHLAGVEGKKVTDESSLAEAYKAAAADGQTAVILITAALCRKYPALIKEFRSHPTPIITELPDEHGLSGSVLAQQLKNGVGIVI